jgi:uncharacterized protein (DUF58 family)
MRLRFVFYLLLLGLCYAFYSFYALPQLLFLLIFLAILPIASFLMLFIGRYFVRARFLTDRSEYYRLEDFRITVEIENRGPFYFPRVRIDLNYPKDPTYIEIAGGNRSLQDRRRLNMVLPRHSHNRREIPVRACHKGSLTLGSDQIYLQDIFGFFRLPLPRQSRSQKGQAASHTVLNLQILPNPELAQAPPNRDLAAAEETLISKENIKVSNEVDTLAKVRDYMPGDRIKQIHWKLSARLGEFLAREFEDPRQGGILFVMDPKFPNSIADPVAYFDQAAELMATVMHKLAKKEGPLTLLLEDNYYDQPGEGVEPVHFYRALSAWQAKQGPFPLNLADVLQREASKQSYRAVVLVGGRIYPKLTSELHKIQKSGSQVLFFFLHNETDEKVRSYLSAMAHSKIQVLPVRLPSLKALEDETQGGTNNA